MCQVSRQLNMNLLSELAEGGDRDDTELGQLARRVSGPDMSGTETVFLSVFTAPFGDFRDRKMPFFLPDLPGHLEFS